MSNTPKNGSHREHAPQNAHATTEARPARSGGQKVVIVSLMVAVAFLLSYNFAAARNVNAATAAGGTLGAVAGGGAAAGGGCCGGGGAPVEGSTSVEGAVQKIAVDTSSGSFNPNVIKAKAGVPIEIAFSQSGGGCLSGVFFPDFNINEDLTSGGKTVKLPALEKGEYTFYCQMQMVSATIVVE